MYSLIDKDDDRFTRIVKYVSIMALPLLILYMIYTGLNQFSDYEEILENKAFTTGVIIDMKYATATTDKISYEYEVDGIKYQQNTINGYPMSCLGKNRNYTPCLGKKFVVIYSILNPEKSELLVNGNKYNIYNLKVPKEFE